MSFFSGSAGTSVKFLTIGTTVTGVLTKPYTVVQSTEFGTGKPEVYPDGQPVMMAVLTLQTDERDSGDDDGIRIVYSAKPGQKEAINSALAAVKKDDLEVGGRLTLTYIGDEPSKTPGFNPVKQWQASYVPPVATVFTGAGGVTPAAAQPDPVAQARAAQTQAAAAHVASAPNAPASSNGAPDPVADIAKIRELGKTVGLTAAQIHGAMPEYSMDQIVAVLAI